MAPFRDPLTTLQEHAAFVRAVARRLVADPSDVDDLVQETWLRALANGRMPESARAWLAKVVRSVWTDRHRAERARQRREQRIAAERASADEAHPAGDDAFGFASLTRALEALPADYRRVLQLRYHADLSPTAIAAELGVPLPTVKTRLARALQLLRADLDARHGDRSWRALLLPLLPQPPGAATAASLAIVTGVLVNKLLVAVAALVALAVLLPHLLEPAPAAAPQATVGGTDVAAVVVPAKADEPAVGPAGTGRAAAEPLPREAASVPTASQSRGLRCRVEYHATGQGVPWLAVHLLGGAQITQLTTDSDGVFTTDDEWPESVEIAIAEAAAPAPRPVVVSSDSLQPLLVTTGLGLPIEPSANPPTFRTILKGMPAEEAPKFRPLATAAVRNGDSWRMQIEFGPTYLLRVEPAGQTGSLRAFLRNTDDANGTRQQLVTSELPLVQPSPRADATDWVRLATAPDWFGERCRLVVVSDDGFWHGELADVPHVGVVGPLDVVLQPRGQVRGVVRDTFGQPLASQRIEVTIGDEARALRFVTETDAQGAYLVACVQPGDGHVRVAGEDFEPHAVPVQVRAGQVATCDLVVRQRQKGGSIAGTIATTSGRKFPLLSVHLTSRQDASIWRTANIEWQEVDGRQQATFAFADVPLVECEVTLNTFEPCRVRARRQTLTPPQEHVHFDVDDQVTTRKISVVVRRQDGTPCSGWTLRLLGDDGWTSSWRPDDPEQPIELPNLPGTWRLFGPTMRARSGRIEAIGGDRLEVAVAQGWSTMLVAMEFPNFFPVRGAMVFADDAPVGTLDESGDLMLDLPAVPQKLLVDPVRWRIYRDAAHRSDVDENGVLKAESVADPQLGVYLQRIP